MVYRNRTKMSKKMANARKRREEIRLSGEPQDYPVDLPKYRRKIIIIDYDFGRVIHQLDMFRSNRCDQYKVFADKKYWGTMGFTHVLRAIQQSFPRVKSIYG